MSKFTSRIKSFSKFEYFYLLTGIACVAIGVEKIMDKSATWKIVVVFGIGIIILLTTYKRSSK
jgi:low affinity Fe/Cu permease